MMEIESNLRKTKSGEKDQLQNSFDSNKATDGKNCPLRLLREKSVNHEVEVAVETSGHPDGEPCSFCGKRDHSRSLNCKEMAAILAASLTK